MPIAKNLGHVPAGGEPDERPVTDPLFAKILAEQWQQEYVDAAPRATAQPCRIRHSDAGKCSRALSYNLLGVETQPLQLADHYRFNMGTLVHDLFQQVARDIWPGAEVETISAFGQANEYGATLTAGHGDLTVGFPDQFDPEVDDLHHVELKTINGYGFQRAIGLKGNAQGPRHGAKLQGALNAMGAGADYLSIVYLSLDVVGAVPAEKVGYESWQRFAAEWRYPRETFEKWAHEELARFNEIVLITDGGGVADRYIPDPEIPEGALITDPAKGAWTLREDDRIFNAGTTWHCQYCPFQKKCNEDAKAGL